jgi:hypothetical protein
MLFGLRSRKDGFMGSEPILYQKVEKMKIFLSSSMHDDELKTEREVAKVIFNKPPLNNYFWLWRFEDQASPDGPKENYLKNLNDSKGVVLILGSNLRTNVVNEYNKAVECKLKIFVYIKGTEKLNPDTQKFIDENVYINHSATKYHDPGQLISKIENDLFEYFKPHTVSIQSKRESEQMKILESGIATDEKAIRLLASIVFSDNRKITQEQIGRMLVTSILQQSDDFTLNIDGIINKIEASLKNITAEFKQNLINTINIMIAEGKLLIKSSPTAQLSLEPNHKKVIRQEIDQKLKLKEKGFSDFFQDNKEKLVGITAEEFQLNIDAIITEILMKDAFSFADEVFADINIRSPHNKERIRQLITEVILKVKPKGDISVWYPIVEEMLVSDYPGVQLYLREKGRAYFILVALNLDPDCTKYEITFLNKYIIFLDSHIILRSLVNAGGEVDLCKKIVSENYKRGIKTYISEPMFRELLNSFKFADEAYKSGNDNIMRVAAFYKKMGFSSDIFDGYVKLLEKGARISWNSYINKYWSPTKPYYLENYLKQEMNIEIYYDEDEILTKISAEIPRIQEKLLKRRNQLRKPDKVINGLERHQIERNWLLRQNEAIQMLLVYHLREKQKEKKESSEVWFITFDEFVYQVNTELANEEDKYLHPSYYLPARWLEMLSMFAIAPTEDSAFRQILLSEEIRRTTSIIEAKVINQLLKDRLDEEIRSVERLKELLIEIVNRPNVQEAYKRVSEADDKQRPEEIIKFQNIVIKELKGEIGKKEQELKSEKASKIKAQRTARYFKSQTGALRRAIDKRKKKKGQ